MVLAFTVIVTLFALNTGSSIYKMVENAYKITLVAAFVPLAFGLYWKPAMRQGALASIVCGLGFWIGFEWLSPAAVGGPAIEPSGDDSRSPAASDPGLPTFSRPAV